MKGQNGMVIVGEIKLNGHYLYACCVGPVGRVYDIQGYEGAGKTDVPIDRLVGCAAALAARAAGAVWFEGDTLKSELFGIGQRVAEEVGRQQFDIEICDKGSVLVFIARMVEGGKRRGAK